MKITNIETRTVPTVKVEFNGKSIVFHSKYDPLHEANIWSKNAVIGLKEHEGILVIGIGAGYHILALAETLPNQNIIVIEFNDAFFSWFKNSPLYNAVAILQNVSIKQFSQLSTDERGNIFSSFSSTNLLIHKNGLDILPLEYENVKEILVDIEIQKKSIQIEMDNMKENFRENILLNDDGIGSLQKIYKGKPMILVSAGPSLDKQLLLLKKINYEKKFIIGAVGTALKPLIKFGITPDFFLITDPNPGTYNQLTGISLPETTFFYLSTTFHNTILLHKGSRRIVWQESFAAAEKMAKEKKDPTIQTGGSVATTLLDLMIYLGGTSLALIGQDLAYTGGKSHANETHAQRERKETRNAKKVLDYYQTGQVNTASNLNIYRKWFESYAVEYSELCLYNCTEGGAYINNWKHISFYDYYLKYS